MKDMVQEPKSDDQELLFEKQTTISVARTNYPWKIVKEHSSEEALKEHSSEEALPALPTVSATTVLESTGRDMPQTNIHLSIANLVAGTYPSKFGVGQVSTHQHFDLNHSKFGLPAPYFEQFPQLYGLVSNKHAQQISPINLTEEDVVLQKALIRMQSMMLLRDFESMLVQYEKKQQRKFLALIAMWNSEVTKNVIQVQSRDVKSQCQLGKHTSNMDSKEAYSIIPSICFNVPYTVHQPEKLDVASHANIDNAGSAELQMECGSQDGDVVSVAKDAVYWHSQGCSVSFAKPMLGKSQADVSSGAAELYALAQQECHEGQTVDMNLPVSVFFTKTLAASNSNV
jgi:hypothetical protein